MFPKDGRKFRRPCSRDDQQDYASAIADALRIELGESHHAIKTLMRWTGANERTVRNWLSGANGPSGEHLVRLIRNSETIFECFLRLAGREALVSIQSLSSIRDTLISTAELLTASLDQSPKG